MLIGDLDRGCFELLFEIENYLRVTLRWEARGRRPKDWLGILPEQFVRSAKERANQEREIGYLDPRRASILSYLNLSELKDVILETTLWEEAFKYHWPPKEVVQTEFKKLLAIRNKSAHCRPVTKRDFRVAHRFAEDLADWTRGYRRARVAARRFRWDSDQAEAYLKGDGLGDLAEYWAEVVQTGDAKRFAIGIEVVGHHLACSIIIPEGSASAEQFIAFMESHESVVTFCRVSELADRLTCYVPRKQDVAAILSCLEALRSIAIGAEPGISSEEVRARFGIEEWESVIPWAFEVPSNFRLQ